MDIGNIPPSILKSIRDQKGLSWCLVAGELCDNSFDAGAQQVAMEFRSPKIFEISDDGKGCRDIERMLTLGVHFRQETTSLGRYGVGLKDAAAWMWGETQIRTKCGGFQSTVSIDWEALASQPDWNVSDPVSSDYEGDSGTKIMFRNIQRRFPKQENLIRDLGYIFSPALLSGRQITIRMPRRGKRVISPWRLPPLDEIVEDYFQINGKGVRLRAGVVQQDATNPRNGFSFCHGHRIVKEATAFGSKGMSIDRVCGTIELDGKWRLSKNKDEIGDPDTDELESAIHERCVHLFELSEAQSSFLTNSALETDISSGLNQLLGLRAKARRGKGDSQGAVEPTGNGVRHRQARRTQDGNSFRKKIRAGRFRIDFKPLDNESAGRVDLLGHRITLNETHFRVAQHRENANDQALVDCCVALLADAAVKSDGANLPFNREYTGFVDCFSELLNGQKDYEPSAAESATAGV